MNGRLKCNIVREIILSGLFQKIEIRALPGHVQHKELSEPAHSKGDLFRQYLLRPTGEGQKLLSRAEVCWEEALQSEKNGSGHQGSDPPG